MGKSDKLAAIREIKGAERANISELFLWEFLQDQVEVVYTDQMCTLNLVESWLSLCCGALWIYECQRRSLSWRLLNCVAGNPKTSHGPFKLHITAVTFGKYFEAVLFVFPGQSGSNWFLASRILYKSQLFSWQQHTLSRTQREAV